MNKLNKKQKIIIAIIAISMVIGICYYAYAKDNTFTMEENLQIENTEEKVQDYEGNDINQETIKIHISGAVNNEGLIELPQNSRIADAIEKAGGVKENVCMEEVNLAYMLEDGMKINIPTKEEIQTQKEETALNKTVTNNLTSETEWKNIINSNISNEQKNNKQNLKVNINTASQTELETLPGIGTSTALKIINYRKESGKFKTKEDIKNVSGIGDSKFNNIKELITV